MFDRLTKQPSAACTAALLTLFLCFAAAAAEFDRNDQPAPMDEHGFGANGDEFHVTAIPQAGQLKLLVERFGEARAITQASVEIHSTDKQVKATEVGDGVYRATESWLLEPGKKALAFTVSAEGTSDVVVMVFDPAQTPSPSAPRESKYGPRKQQEQAQ